MKLMQVLHTIRHLKGRQVAGQIAHRIRRSIEDPSAALVWDETEFPGCIWKPAGPFVAPPAQPHDFAAGELSFLNRTHDTGWPPNWDCADLPKLWRYNLHYFDFLWQLDYPQVERVVLDWIDRYHPARGRVGWEPYPTSLRLMNWCAVLFQKFREESSGIHEAIWPSIVHQTNWLRRHIETHLMGNHVLENAAALTLAGSCFAGKQARCWLDIGSNLLRRELREQLLPDGGHFERSPMYQRRVVHVLTMLHNIGRVDGALLDLAVNALRHMTHPDGRIALLNDSAFGIYNHPDKPGPIGNFALPQTGYFGARTTNGSYIICDAAPIGPDYLPGHAHGDMLSFELSLRGHRVIVDSGVHDYERGPMRDYCRSTRAHNTVEIDGQDQCEFWDVFRVGQRGHVRDVRWRSLDGGFELSAWHDGYHRLPSRATHARTFRFNEQGIVKITDLLRAASPVNAVSRLHLHPECRILKQAERESIVAFPGGECAIEFSGPGEMRVEESQYCPEFGRAIQNQCIAWHCHLPRAARIELRIADLSR